MNFNNLRNTWIIAEIGVNHEGDFSVACDLIKKAAACGVDAVKFQTYQPTKYISSEQPERLQRVSRFQLSYDQFSELSELAKQCGVVFFSTPLHPEDADFLDGIAPIFKISSGDITHLELIKHVARKNKPTIISTGAGSPEEVVAAVEAFISEQPNGATNGNLMLMHCVAAYPAPVDAVNLRNMHWLQKQFGVPVGYSDHTLGQKTCELAVAAGAVAIEKHFTYRKEDQDFHDHRLSADPSDMSELVAAIRHAELLLGNEVRERSEDESNVMANLRRSLAVSVDLPEGAVLGEEFVTYLRPAWGLGPEQYSEVIGRKLTRALRAGSLIRPEDLE